MNDSGYSFFRSVLFAGILVSVLWVVKATEWFLGADFGSFGIFPQHVAGLKGILFSPFIHGSWQHLLNNTGPVFLLLIVLINGYPKVALQVVIFIHLVSGFLVWATIQTFGYHIGISGIIYGLASFLIASGIFRKDRTSVSIAIIVALAYGGMIFGFIPQQGVSWQSHFWGAVSGVVIAVLYRNRNLPVIANEEQDDETEADEGHFFETTPSDINRQKTD
jgi:membrane associated rhomboid family serine protease